MLKHFTSQAQIDFFSVSVKFYPIALDYLTDLFEHVYYFVHLILV